MSHEYGQREQLTQQGHLEQMLPITRQYIQRYLDNYPEAEPALHVRPVALHSSKVLGAAHLAKDIHHTRKRCNFHHRLQPTYGGHARSDRSLHRPRTYQAPTDANLASSRACERKL